MPAEVSSPAAGPAVEGGPRAGPAASQAAWYYDAGGQPGGPVTAAELRDMITKRRITPATLVWYHPLSGWAPASRFASLAA